jgi:hypothetical protein
MCPAERESALQRALTAWIITGLAFMLIPGTFLGVWNLFAITGGRGAAPIAPAWIQAHGHAQIFGWIGSFIIGIGFYSLSKMANLAPFHVRRAWIAWALWTAGVALRWATNLYSWQWRAMLPISAALEFAAFAIFFVTVSKHRRTPGAQPQPRQVWMELVMASTAGFAACLVANLALAVRAAIDATGPAVGHLAEQRLLTAYVWAFIVPAIWGFSARWLPIFLGLAQPDADLLRSAWVFAISGIACALFGAWLLAGAVGMTAAMAATFALHVWTASERPPKVTGVHASFPYFVRIAYAWLLAGSALAIWAAANDRTGGIWGASRHALTVGFMSTMVFSIGQRVLPAFCGMRLLYSSRLMFWSLALLTAGCALRVSVEPLAYEGYAPALWPLLPVSASIEMLAFTLFAANLVITLLRPPAHLRLQTIQSTL